MNNIFNKLEFVYLLYEIHLYCNITTIKADLVRKIQIFKSKSKKYFTVSYVLLKFSKKILHKRNN